MIAMKKFQLMAAIALTMCFISCSQQADTATGKQAATDSTMIETADDDNAETAELILTGNGIEGVLGLGTALDQLPAQVDGLYDKVEIRREEDEGESVTIADFTLAGKTVMTGMSNDGKTLSNLDITGGTLTLRDGDKTWRMGDKPDGLKTNEYGQYTLYGITILTGEDGNINQMLVGTWQ